MFRVQKVLLTEYQEIYEPVMVESPFTLVDAHGVGLRQYHIALTGTKLLFGCDNFYKHEEYGSEPNWYCLGQDPEIECFDLISMVPLEYIRFNFYRKRERYLMMLSVQPLEQHLPAERPMIFEFGGHIHKQYFWHTWRERIASIRTHESRFNQITGASPFSSSDIQMDEVQHHVQVHVPHYRPQSIYSVCCSSAGGA
ncbi:uncharacterized protein [Drosophila virilis]|uniref:Uncharacterized protein n=1 Tax=Drosophila virilis TaxID=7244 RepID=B4LMD4_DROVI|nr:uncharacterized protein LOC6627055 [Drosophila virilis]EDW62029.1 uncharacterized protein Dvir_GJ22370 [Drosophila virilis]